MSSNYGYFGPLARLPRTFNILNNNIDVLNFGRKSFKKISPK